MDQTSPILYPIEGEFIKAKFIPKMKSASMTTLLNFLLFFPFVGGLYFAYELAPLIASWPAIDWPTFEEMIIAVVILIVLLLVEMLFHRM